MFPSTVVVSVGKRDQRASRRLRPSEKRALPETLEAPCTPLLKCMTGCRHENTSQLCKIAIAPETLRNGVSAASNENGKVLANHEVPRGLTKRCARSSRNTITYLCMRPWPPPSSFNIPLSVRRALFNPTARPAAPLHAACTTVDASRRLCSSFAVSSRQYRSRSSCRFF